MLLNLGKGAFDEDAVRKDRYYKTMATRR